MKARIEELVLTIYAAALSSSHAGERAGIRAALTTLAEECYERAAKECAEHGDMVGKLGVAATNAGEKDRNYARARACYINRDAILALKEEL